MYHIHAVCTQLATANARKCSLREYSLRKRSVSPSSGTRFKHLHCLVSQLTASQDQHTWADGKWNCDDNLRFRIARGDRRLKYYCDATIYGIVLVELLAFSVSLSISNFGQSPVTLCLGVTCAGNKRASDSRAIQDIPTIAVYM
jgi:hypothetical protein